MWEKKISLEIEIEKKNHKLKMTHISACYNALTILLNS